MVEGKNTGLADHFQTLDWLLLELEKTQQKFTELATKKRRTAELHNYKYLAACAEASWRKCEKYYLKVDNTSAYYVEIVLNPTLKMQWFHDQWAEHKDKEPRILKAESLVRELWLEYKGKVHTASSVTTPNPVRPPPKPKTYTSARNHKRLKTVHPDDDADVSATTVDRLQEYLETNCLHTDNSGDFDVIQYWLDRYESQPDLAQFALDILAVPPMSDECGRLFSSCKILLEDRRSRLQMDIIEANECLRHWYGPPVKGSFDNAEVGVTEGEPAPPLISPKEASKARVAAYKKAMEDAAKAAAAAVAVEEDTLAEPSEPIELDSDDENDSDDDAYAAFEDIEDIEAIEVEDEGDSVLD